jgi:hypothetical protein
VAGDVGACYGHAGRIEGVCGFLLDLFEVGFERFVQRAGFLELHFCARQILLEGFEPALEVLVGDAQDGELVAQLLVPGEEQLLECLAFAFAS